MLFSCYFFVIVFSSSKIVSDFHIVGEGTGRVRWVFLKVFFFFRQHFLFLLTCGFTYFSIWIQFCIFFWCIDMRVELHSNTFRLFLKTKYYCATTYVYYWCVCSVLLLFIAKVVFYLNESPMYFFKFVWDQKSCIIHFFSNSKF